MWGNGPLGHAVHMQLGEAIRSARQRRGLTQAQLGEALPNRVHAKTVSKWERGLAIPRGQLPALERALGLRLTNRASAPADPAEMSSDDLVGAIVRLVSELARRAPDAETPTHPLAEADVLARGWSAIRREDVAQTNEAEHAVGE